MQLYAFGHIKKITKNVLEATILTGTFKGEVVLLPRIPMIPSESTIPFRRLQFPIRLAFAMSINKSQGQTISICGLDLENPCFLMGMFMCRKTFESTKDAHIV